MKTMKNRIISATIAMTALIVAAATAVSCDGGKSQAARQAAPLCLTPITMC